MRPIRSAWIGRRLRHADQNHGYTAEQQAYDGGKADLFPKYTGNGDRGWRRRVRDKGQVMGYYDGNTVTALWNYAQHFAMSDNAYTDTYGPSTPGALEVVSGQTNGVNLVKRPTRALLHSGRRGRLQADRRRRPGRRRLLEHDNQVQMLGRNIGDLLNAQRHHLGRLHGRLQPAD